MNKKKYLIAKYKLQGYVSLVSVLVIIAAGTAMVSVLLWLSTGSAKSSILAFQSEKAKNLADACAEEALTKLKDDYNYSGNEAGSIVSADGSCFIRPVVNPGTATPSIEVTGTVNDITRKIVIDVSQDVTQVVVNDWQEVAVF